MSQVLDSLPEAAAQNVSYDNDDHNATVFKKPVSPAKNSSSEVSDAPERQSKLEEARHRLYKLNVIRHYKRLYASEDYAEALHPKVENCEALH